jgi:hypothetical protein
VRVDHAPALYTYALPARSTPAQNVVDGHEMPNSPGSDDTNTGADHVPALQVNTLPPPSTVRQSVAVGQETEVKSPFAGSTETGADHDAPLYVTAPPCSSVAIQKLDVGHETELIWPRGAGSKEVPADQPGAIWGCTLRTVVTAPFSDAACATTGGATRTPTTTIAATVGMRRLSEVGPKKPIGIPLGTSNLLKVGL